MTLLLETRGKGPTYTLWTHDTSIGNKWQRCHAHFVDTWHFYCKHVATVSSTLCEHITLLWETRGNGPIYTLWTHDTFIGNTWQRCHVHFVDTWHFYWKHVATVSSTLCEHITLLLETRGNSPTYTLWTHNTSIGNTWQRSHVHFVDTWHFYWKHVATVPCTLCGHMSRLLETRGKAPMYTLWTHDTSIGNTWQRCHVHFVDTWHFYWKHVATVSSTLCEHMTLLLETRGNSPMYTLWTHDTSIGNTWQRLMYTL
jgi:uncharacterized protein (DUF736 family)